MIRDGLYKRQREQGRPALNDLLTDWGLCPYELTKVVACIMRDERLVEHGIYMRKTGARVQGQKTCREMLPFLRAMTAFVLFVKKHMI